MEQYEDHCSIRSGLIPLAKHTALVHCILNRLEESNPLHYHNWDQFEALFRDAIQKVIKTGPSLSKESLSEVVNAGIECVNHAVLKKANQ